MTPPSNLPFIIHHSQFDHVHYKDTLFSLFSIEYPTVLKGAYNKRKAEFLAGRYSARQSLIHLSTQNTVKSNTDFNILVGHNRQPLFPTSFCGSITHAEQIALCVVGLSKNFHAFGIDLEPIVSNEYVSILKKQVLHLAEYELARRASLDINVMLTLIFSAKESLFKALYPDVGAYFDFFVAQVTDVECDCTGGEPLKNSWSKFSIKLCQSLTDNLPSGTIFTGFYCVLESGVLSLICLEVDKELSV